MARRHSDYTIACICPMVVEMTPVTALLDSTHASLPTRRDLNNYKLGEMCGHNIVIATPREIGLHSCTATAVQLLNDFPSIRFGLLVGIGGGVPSEDGNGSDVRLGDVVISTAVGQHPGVVQYDSGKFSTTGGFERTGSLNHPPPVLVSSVKRLAAEHGRNGSKVPQYIKAMLRDNPTMTNYTFPGAQYDQLFRMDYIHQDRGGSGCDGCEKQGVVNRVERRSTDPFFHYGLIGSAHTVVKDASLRDSLRRSLNVICLEMEAAGLMNPFPCLVIRGICDYADSHKNKTWQPYAAATAAAYMKELLSIVPVPHVTELPQATNPVQSSKFKRGMNLLDAADIGQGQFVGREDILEQMEEHLLPNEVPADRKRLILGGMGGIGKTQLAINYAKTRKDSYSAIFWLNATSKSLLKADIRKLAPRILQSGGLLEKGDEELWTRVSLWLSEPENFRWLIVFDNYEASEDYKIESYYPFESHGTIIITSRQPFSITGNTLIVPALTKDEDGLRILATRSGRTDLAADSGAITLVRRLCGLPLALATAGSFLQQSAISISEYLQIYEASWKQTDMVQGELPEYPEKTLYTTWDLSFRYIEKKMPLAACLLRFTAYLDNQDVWFGLLQGAREEARPQWFSELISHQSSFEQVMRILSTLCLVESHQQTSSYSIHVCVHDWALHRLNFGVDEDLYYLAVACVAGEIPYAPAEALTLSSVKYQRLAPHAVRLASTHFLPEIIKQDTSLNRLVQSARLGSLLHQQAHFEDGERMLSRTITCLEDLLGFEHEQTLETANELGLLYFDSRKLVAAKAMHERILAAKLSHFGPTEVPPWNTMNHLGMVYHSQGNLEKAEEMFGSALSGMEKTLGWGAATLDIINSLCNLYRIQGRLGLAEITLKESLLQCQEVLGLEHPSVLTSMKTLGNVYQNSGKREEAEKTYDSALKGHINLLGADHPNTLDLIDNLGLVYRDQERLHEAEKWHKRALQGKEKRLGPRNISTLGTVNNLGICHLARKQYAAAEIELQRALAGMTEILGEGHQDTLDVITNLGILYYKQGRMADAERMFQIALSGKKQRLGSENKSTLITMNNLGTLYQDTGRLEEAEEMFREAFAGLQKTVGLAKPLTLTVLEALGDLLNEQERYLEASEAYQLVYEAKIECFGAEHDSTLSARNKNENVERKKGGRFNVLKF